MATVARRRNRYVVDWRDASGRRRWKSFKKKKEADAYRDQVSHDKRRGIVVDDRKTFADLVDAFIKARKPNVKETTFEDYQSTLHLHLKPYFDGYKLREITLEHVEAFVADQVEKAIGLRTINKALTLLVMLFNYANKHQWMASNPARYVDRPQARDGDHRDDVDESILSPAEFQRVLEKAEPPWRLIFKTAALTGLRQGELLGLRWRNVDFDKGELLVRDQYTHGRFSTLKTKAARRAVPMPADLANDLRRHKLASNHKEVDMLVFCTSTGGPVNQSNLNSRGWRPALRRAKVRPRRFHSLRHLYASTLIRHNVSMKVVSTLCGHSSITITMNTYGHMLPDSTDGVAEALADTLLGQGGSKTVAAGLKMANVEGPNRAQVAER